jgi:LDH2 family malate/lactate/ureidoglycolate dehydrogenase
MDALVDQIRGGERADGVDELVLPGERGERRHRELAARGAVALDDAGWDMLRAGCETLGVPPPDVS